MPFSLDEDELALLFKAANFPIDENEMILAGLRGCVPVDSRGTEFAASQRLEYVGVDYLHMRCTLLQWKPGSGFAVFPASTVPHVDLVRPRIEFGGRGVNQLALGCYRGSHRYYRGDHMASKPSRRHRALRNDSVLPVWRTGDDADYEGDDTLDVTSVPGDNIHCAWQQNPAGATYSSQGCQVIAGRPRVLARGWSEELGPWARFIDNVYGLAQQRFVYALFSGREVLAVADVPGIADRYQTVRFGSQGELVETVQEALHQLGYDLGPAGADGDLGFGTLTALRNFQERQFGKSGTDLVVGPSTAAALGLSWPKLGGAAPAFVAPVAEPEGPAQPAAVPASANNATESTVTPNYRSLTTGGFYSDDPFDLGVKRAIRTNNPGALNIRPWQKAFPGFVGETQPDHAGNRTTIYVTPEHGIAAWYHLLTNRYGYGQTGRPTLVEIAKRYAGVPTDNHPAVRSYLKGWKRWSGGTLNPSSQIDLASDPDVVQLAQGMFGHEIGDPSPLKVAQIKKALQLKRSGTLPSN